jgi:hypothetical protein
MCDEDEKKLYSRKEGTKNTHTHSLPTTDGELRSRIYLSKVGRKNLSKINILFFTFLAF